MKISELLKKIKPSFSFEFFPPKTDEDVRQLFQTAETLKALNPTYVSVTWGAGGSTHRKTIDTVCGIKKNLGIDTLAHLTCVGASQDDLTAILGELQERGVENILALRGDPPKGETQFVPAPDGFSHADQLVAHIRRSWGFCIGVACYPERHPESASPEADIDHFIGKVEAGADFAATQLFFDNRFYFEFVEKVAKRGVRIPILPGLMPITSVSQIKRFTSLCGATVPKALMAELERRQDDPAAVIQLGIEHSTRQAEELLRRGAPGIHFYTMNRSLSTEKIVRNLLGRV
ncbi:MAG TPA: methylenetetrahydrofolate reductase [NAD(P)H] [Elusimicrobiota bacterium]|nr:methylenetetrahydrofolate reductase [NAD(P)H] [Elusimicrobiota bacterium]